MIRTSLILLSYGLICSEKKVGPKILEIFCIIKDSESIKDSNITNVTTFPCREKPNVLISNRWPLQLSKSFKFKFVLQLEYTRRRIGKLWCLVHQSRLPLESTTDYEITNITHQYNPSLLKYFKIYRHLNTDIMYRLWESQTQHITEWYMMWRLLRNPSTAPSSRTFLLWTWNTVNIRVLCFYICVHLQ